MRGTLFGSIGLILCLLALVALGFTDQRVIGLGLVAVAIPLQAIGLLRQALEEERREERFAAAARLWKDQRP